MSLYDRDYMRDEPPSLGDKLRSLTAFHWIFWLNILIFIAQYVFRVGWSQEGLGGYNGPMGAVSVSGLTHGEVWTPFTYMFVHGNLIHIIFNMFGLWLAGKRVQDLYGPRHFVLIYVLSGLVGAAAQLTVYAYAWERMDATLVGASAAILGLLLAYAVAMPEEEIALMLFFVIPVRFRLWTLAKFLMLLNLGLGVLTVFSKPGAGDGSGVAYFAHLGGALAGWYYARSMGYGGLPPNLGQEWLASQRRRRPAMASARRRPVVELDLEAVKRQAPRQEPSVDFMRDEVDPILDKISDHGMHSLTEDERRILERASRQMAKKDGKSA